MVFICNRKLPGVSRLAGEAGSNRLEVKLDGPSRHQKGSKEPAQRKIKVQGRSKKRISFQNIHRGPQARPRLGKQDLAGGLWPKRVGYFNLSMREKSWMLAPPPGGEGGKAQ